MCVGSYIAKEVGAVCSIPEVLYTMSTTIFQAGKQTLDCHQSALFLLRCLWQQQKRPTNEAQRVSVVNGLFSEVDRVVKNPGDPFSPSMNKWLQPLQSMG